MSKLSAALLDYKEKHKDLPWEEIAYQMQISEQMIHKYIKGEAKPRKDTLELIAGFLGVPIADLEEEKASAPEKTEVRIVIGKPEGEKADEEIVPFYEAAVQRIKLLGLAISRNPEDFDRVQQWTQEIMAQIALVDHLVEKM